ncbi:DUF6701 domain-containing protein [Rheinheimera sp. WS51]|uniref:DUF6701 domain-containing protein n=1 Tax=Rheinheimera sp. WS51 TaxID=3425886 RepID=UPI003D8DE6FE
MILRVLVIFLLVFSQAAIAMQCTDLWSQAVTSNSANPTSVPFPDTPNESFPQPLVPGDYYYNSPASYSISNNTQRTTTGATARLFINGNLTIGNNSQLNVGGPAENLIIVVSGNLTINNNAEVNGFILAGGAISLNNNVVINGAVTAKGSVASSGATINYRPASIANIEGGVVCDQPAPLPSPLAEYRFDQLTWNGSADEVLDSIGSNHGVAVNANTIDQGQICRAGEFSGNNSYVRLNDLSVLTGTASLSFWIKTTATGDNAGWRAPAVAGVEQSGGADDIFWGWIDASGKIGLTKGNDFTATKSNSSINNGRFRHVVLTRNAANGEFQIFIDGTLDRSGSLASQQGTVTTTFNDIGRVLYTNGSGANYLNAQLDEVQIYAEIINASQVQQLYQLQLEQRNSDGEIRECPTSGLQCLADDFSSADLSDSWVTATSGGTFLPQVVNGRLRLTEARTNQATSATYQRLYPAEDNLVVIEFDYWAYGGSSADGIAVVLSDAKVTPQPGAFGGALGYGYKSGISGFAGGWLGFGLDEYGNFSNEGGVGSIGRRRQSVVIRGSGSGTSGYRYLRGTCNNGTTNVNTNCLSPAVDGNQSSPHRYRFVVDSTLANQTLVSVFRDTGSGFQELIAPFNAQSATGQAPVPENFLLSLTGSTGGSTNIHELDNLSICALQSFGIGQQVDHFEFDYSGQALTCSPESFTVRACKNAACTELVTEPVTADLSPASLTNGGWVGGNQISFSGGSTVVDLRQPAAGNVTIGVTSSVPSTKPLSRTLCRAGAGGLNEASCTINFADSGFVFDINDGIANLEQTNVLIKAVRKSDTSQQCIPAFADVTRDVAFWSDYITPGATGRPVSLPVSVNTTNVGINSAAATKVSLNFNGQGEAAMAINYPDAGQVQLNARYNGSAANDDTGLVMQGADQFIRRPAALCIQTQGECSAADSSCAKFKKAGERFDLTITARAYGSNADACSNAVTPNFVMVNIPMQHQLVAPSPGNLGTIAVSSYNHTANIDGQAVLSQSVSEVGIFTFNTPALNYLTMADPIPAAASAATGRFVPDHYVLTQGSVIPACSAAFSYFGQKGFTTSFNIKAVNTSGIVTQNYKDSFAKLNINQWTDTTASVGLRYSAPSLPTDSVLQQGDMTPVGNWHLGEADIVSTHYATKPSALSAPLLLDLYATPVDSDGVTLHSSADGIISSSPTELRFGRLVLDNAFGPEDVAMPLSFYTEYWQGDQFILNKQDSCTVITGPADPVAGQSCSFSPSSGDQCNTIAGSSELTLVGSAGNIDQGVFPASSLLIKAPNIQGEWRLQYNTEPWLRYNWRDASSGFSQQPQADIHFGRFRGNPRQIYWRELFH